MAVDLEEGVLEQARSNARLNGLEDRVEFRQADMLTDPPAGRFEMVCANLYAQVLTDMAPWLVRTAQQVLVLSGIRDVEADGVAQAFAGNGATETTRDGDGEWTGLVFRTG